MGVTFEMQVNHEMVELSRMNPVTKHPAYPTDSEDLKEMLDNHVRFTGSEVAANILSQWPQVLTEFVRVFPKDFMKALEKGDRGASAIESLRTWIPVDGQPPAPPKSGAAEPLPKFSIQRLVLDIEDADEFVKGHRPKVAEPESLVKNGFVRYDRAEIKKRDARERAEDFIEVYEHKDEALVRTQAAR